MDKSQIIEIMEHLASERGIFHSEADFQHAFAWLLHIHYPNLNIRLEYPLRTKEKTLHIDIFAYDSDSCVAIELKYKTRGLKAEVNNEKYSLQNQSAQDLGRYDFLKDIVRLEYAKSQIKNFLGFAIILTNDSAYWKSPNSQITVDKDFRIHSGKRITGVCKWMENASDGTIKKREEPIVLSGNYIAEWNYFSRFPVVSWNEFKYLILPVT